MIPLLLFLDTGAHLNNAWPIPEHVTLPLHLHVGWSCWAESAVDIIPLGSVAWISTSVQRLTYCASTVSRIFSQRLGGMFGCHLAIRQWLLWLHCGHSNLALLYRVPRSNSGNSRRFEPLYRGRLSKLYMMRSAFTLYMMRWAFTVFMDKPGNV